MVTLIVPGYSLKNKDWALSVSKNISLDHEIRPIFWDHWENPGKHFDAKEKGRILGDVGGAKITNVIAKSIGTLVASYIIIRNPGAIGKIIFCGVPLNDLSETNKETIQEALKSLPPEKIICFQNEADPHGTFGQVEIFLAEINPKIKVVSKNRSDHEYPYFTEFQDFLKA